MTRSRLELAIGGRPVTVQAELPTTPIRPRRLLPMLRELTNAVVGAAVAASEERGAVISCRAGCGACCRQLVPITPTEARALRALVAALPAARQHEVKARFDDAAKRLGDAALLDSLLHPERVSEEGKEELALRYFALGIPCPFLEADSCSIHPERPLACREYLVTSEPSHCAAPRADTIQMVPLASEVSTALGKLDVAEGAPAPWVPLIVASAWSEAHPDNGTPKPAATLLQEVLGLLE